MRMKVRWMPALLGMLAVLLVLPACGGKGDLEDPGSTSRLTGLKFARKAEEKAFT
jgi:predicted small lipoprotein YifL